MNRTASSAAIHRETVAEAGIGQLSAISVLAGLVTAYGTFAVVAAIAGSVLASGDVDTEFRTNDWTGSGAVAALTSAVVLLIAYVFGGYVTGRMARRRAVRHGVVLAVATLVVGAIAGGVVSALTDDASIRSNLRSIGVPTTMDQVTDVAIAGVIISLVAIVAGSILGAVAGERWHTKLARRVADPDIGASAVERERLEQEQEARRARLAEEQGARRDRIDGDPVLARDERRIDLVAAEGATERGDAAPRYTEAEWRARDLEATRRQR